MTIINTSWLILSPAYDEVTTGAPLIKVHYHQEQLSGIHIIYDQVHIIMGHCNGCQRFIVQRYISFHSFIPWLTTSDTYVHTQRLQLARAKEVEQYSEQSCIPESLIVNSSKFYYQRSKEFISLCSNHCKKVLLAICLSWLWSMPAYLSNKSSWKRKKKDGSCPFSSHKSWPWQ